MPYLPKSEEELDLQIKNIKDKNEAGNGLNNEEIQIGLYTISKMLKKAAESIEPKEGARRLNELKMELESTAKAFDDLRDPEILDDPGKFEDALREVSNFKDLMLERTHNGHLYFEIIEQRGKDFDEETDAYNREGFFETLKNLDSVIDAGLGDIDKTVKGQLGKKARNEYLKKREVTDFKNDPDNLAIASMLEKKSEFSKNLESFISRHESHWSGDHEYMAYVYAKTLRDKIEEINITGSIVGKRELMIEASETYKSLKKMARKIGISNDRFPIDLGQPDSYSLEGGRQFLDTVFDENSPKVIKHLQVRKNINHIALPADVSPEMAAAHFTRGMVLSNRKNDSIHTNRNLLDAMYLVMFQMKNDDKELSEHTGEISQAFGELNESIKKLENERKDLDEDDDLSDLNENYIKDAAGKVEKMIKSINDFYQDNKERPELIERFNEHCAPFIVSFNKMNFKAGTELYHKDHLNVPEAKAEPEDYEVLTAAEKNATSNIYFSTTEVYNQQSRLEEKAITAMNANATKNKNMVNGLYLQAKTLIDDGKMFAQDRTLLPAVENKLISLKNTLTNLENGKKPDYNSYSQGEKVFTLRNIAADRMTDVYAHRETRKFYLDLYNKTNKIAMDLLKQEKDPLKAYIAIHSDPYSGTENIHKVVAAYLWQHDELKKNLGRRPKFNLSEIEKRASALKNDPLFLSYLEPNEKDNNKFRREWLKKKEKSHDPGYYTEDRYKDEYEKFKEKTIKAKTKSFAQTKNVPVIVAAIERPFGYNTDATKQREALNQLKELGQIMDRCSFWSSKEYKNFYNTLKDLSKKDIASMKKNEMSDLLDDIYKKTAAFMNGRMGVRKKPEQREHFEQTLDALAILARTSETGNTLAKELIRKTNNIRKAHHQDSVSLVDRNSDNSRERLGKLRNKLVDLRSGDELLKIGNAISGNEKLVPASKFESAEQLSKLPKNVAKTVNINEEKNKIYEAMKSENCDFWTVKENIPKMIALSHTIAYKDAKGDGVMDAKEYEKNITLAKNFGPTSKIVDNYSNADKREELMSSDNPADEVYNAFRSALNEQKLEQDKDDAKILGAAYKVDDEIIAGKIKQRHQKRVADKLMKENPYEIAKDFDDLDRQLEAMDAANDYNRDEEDLYGEYNILKDNDKEKIVGDLKNRREEIKIKKELEEEKKKGTVNEGTEAGSPKIKQAGKKK